MQNRLYIQLYDTMILQTRRGTTKSGGFVNAKPVFLLALIEAIRKGDVISNTFRIDGKLRSIYNGIYSSYENGSVTPLFLPYFHLASDGYYHIKWNEQSTRTERPSMKLFSEKVDYSYFDNALWDLLQNEEIRKHYEDLIISYFKLDSKTK